ncbi:MAG: hypothetical protein H7Y89_06185, partial [Steroidobacteraceae bacterium]|nr:hypothetical protein [Steroidobacteraceae bacterium]
MTIVSFKSKYIAVAVVAAIIVSLAVGAILIYANRAQHVALIDSAAADARSRVLGELTLRANETAKRLGDKVAHHVLRGERDAAVVEVDQFKTDATLMGVILRGTAGNEIYSWRRSPEDNGTISRSVTAPVRANIEAMPGLLTPQTVGEVEIEIRSLESSPESAIARAHFDAMQRSQLRKSLFVAGGMGGIALAIGLTLAWWAGRRMNLPISTLIRSAD